MNDFIRDRYENYEVLTGEIKAPEPPIVCFLNSRLACNMLYKHIKERSGVIIHGDVDFDGVGSTYVGHSFISEFNMRDRIGTCINKEKVHGISKKHVSFFNKSGAKLVIIVDSSTNDIEYIKQLSCDVLVVDHHEILHNELSGKTAGGQYIIVNNNADNEDMEFGSYKADERMSGALVLYEMLRLYQHIFKTGDILKGKMLYQWVGITLFTDAVNTCTLRNQYYLDLTVHNVETEDGLKKMMQGLSKYHSALDKSFIQYQIGPAFNRAIRAGYSALALNCAIQYPGRAYELLKFKDVQDRISKGANDGVAEYSQYATKELTGGLVSEENLKGADSSTVDILREIESSGMVKNYCGLIATKILSHLNKSTVVYRMNGEYAEGSFRGKYGGIDYRKFFDDWADYTFAQGHRPAFGFKVKMCELPTILLGATNLESTYESREYLTAGRLLEQYKGIHHIDNFDDFKKQGLLWRLAMANSKLSTEDSINIVIPNESLGEAVPKGKAFTYTVFGFECLAFEEMVTPLLEIYIEYTREMKFYIKNKWR